MDDLKLDLHCLDELKLNYSDSIIGKRGHQRNRKQIKEKNKNK